MHAGVMWGCATTAWGANNSSTLDLYIETCMFRLTSTIPRLHNHSSFGSPGTCRSFLSEVQAQQEQEPGSRDLAKELTVCAIIGIGIWTCFYYTHFIPTTDDPNSFVLPSY